MSNINICKKNKVRKKKNQSGWLNGQAVKFTHSALAAQSFAGLDAGCRHGTAHEAMLRQHPTCHNQKDPQLKSYHYVPGDFGEKKEK